MPVTFENVSLTRNGIPVLRDLSFSTLGTPVFIVFGDSGAGKTSLLRLVNRLDDCDRGRITVNGAGVRTEPPAGLRRRVGMIFQEPRLLPGTVSENIRLGATRHGIPADSKELLADVGLEGFENRDAMELSGGQKHRVALARALAVEPEILLLDEPTASLDRTSASVIVELILKKVTAGLEVLWVTHSRSQVERLGGRGILVKDGRIAFDGFLPEQIGDNRV